MNLEGWMMATTNFCDYVNNERSRIAEECAGRIPPTLYHYTSVEGLKGIIESGGLWAACVYHQPPELAYGLDLSRRVICELAKEKPSRQNEIATLQSALDTLELAVDEGFLSFPYISCLCDSPKCLGMWRHYAANGYCVGLVGNKLYQALKGVEPLNRPALYDVVYDEREQRRIIRETVDRWLLDEPATYPNYAASLLYFHVVRFKGPWFREEREWRIIRDTSLGSPPELRFRTRSDEILSYVLLDLTLANVLPLDSVWFAWSLSEKPTKRAIRDLLYAKGREISGSIHADPYGGVQITRSCIPL
jgi:hypothetical protein